MIAAVVIEMTLDFVMAINLSRGSVFVDSSAVVSCSDDVRRFSFLKLSVFSSLLVRLESDLFLVRCEVIASFEDCLFNEFLADAVVESVFLAELMSPFVLDVSFLDVFSGLCFVDCVCFRFDGSLFNGGFDFVVDTDLLRLLLASFFNGSGDFLLLCDDFNVELFLLSDVLRCDNRDWSFLIVGFKVGFPGGFAAVNLFLDDRTLELREKLLMLPDRERFVAFGFFRVLAGLGSREVDLELTFSLDVLLLRPVAPEF